MFSSILTTISSIRDLFWHYPDLFVSEDTGLFNILAKVYLQFRPFSHIFLAITFLSSLVYSWDFISPFAFMGENDVVIEAVVVGTEGVPRRVNPLVTTANQLEKDLSYLIYPGLVRIDSKGDPKPLLVKSWKKIDEKGKEFRFNLRDDIHWHDGQKLTADDVEKTFELVGTLGGGSSYSEAVKKLTFEKIDDYSFKIRLEEVNPTIFENVSFGIMQAKRLEGVNVSNIKSHKINTNPVGTGPFKMKQSSEEEIVLETNSDYFGDKPKIGGIVFKLFETEKQAIAAMKSGQAHTVYQPSIESQKSVESWSNIEVKQSSPLYRRYWAIYFNLKESGPKVLEDQSVRKAISLAVDRQKIIDEALNGGGKEAMGPIAESSWAYATDDIARFRFDKEEANKTLEELGWKYIQKEEGGIVLKYSHRMKENETLEFELAFVDSPEKRKIAECIQYDLEQVGIKVDLDGRSLEDVRDALLAPRNFDALLYGVETSIDPDRYRLWHEDEILFPGLNISSYISSLKTVSKKGRVSALLEEGRLTMDREQRKGSYEKFQKYLLEDCPAVFLYHPTFTYMVNKRLEGVDLSGITAPEERFLNVAEWEIK